jgi:hypothetical protein
MFNWDGGVTADEMLQSIHKALADAQAAKKPWKKMSDEEKIADVLSQPGAKLVVSPDMTDLLEGWEIRSLPADMVGMSRVEVDSDLAPGTVMADAPEWDRVW